MTNGGSDSPILRPAISNPVIWLSPVSFPAPLGNVDGFLQSVACPLESAGRSPVVGQHHGPDGRNIAAVPEQPVRGLAHKVERACFLGVLETRKGRLAPCPIQTHHSP